MAGALPRPRILLTRPDVPGADLLDRAAERLGADVVRLAPVPGGADPDAGVLAEALRTVDAVLAQPVDPLGAAALAGAARLRVVAVAGVGVDRVDLVAARERGVVVTNTPGVLAETVADTAMALVLMARRRLVVATDAMRAGRWTGFDPGAFLGHDVAGATLGVLGYGEIGRAVARRALGFGMRVQHLARPSAPADGVSVPVGREVLLRTSDVLVLTLPLTAETRGTLDAASLALLRPDATVVNVGRGPLVVEADLVAALREGRLHSAGLDVFDGEPRGSPDDAVMRTPGLVVLPHVGSASLATRTAMTRAAVRNLEAVLRGEEPPTPVVAGVVKPGTPPADASRVTTQPGPETLQPLPGPALDPVAVAAACAGLQAVPVHGLLSELCSRARLLLDADRAAVSVADGQELVIVASQSRVPVRRGAREPGARLPIAGSVAGMVLASGEAHVVHDTLTHPLGAFPLNAVDDIRSSVVLPLGRRGAGGGAVLTIMSSRPGAMDERCREAVETLLSVAREGEDRLGQAVEAATSRSRADGEQLYRAVLESLGEGVVVHGHLGRVLLHNDAAPRLLGMAASDLVGLPVADPRWGMFELDGTPVPVDDLPAARALRTAVVERDRMLLLRRPGGDERVTSVTSLPRVDDDGRAYSVVVSFTDVTLAHRLAEQTQEQARRLNAAMQLAQLATWETPLGSDDSSFSDLLHQVTGRPPHALVGDASVRGWYGTRAYARLLHAWGQVLEHRRPRQVTVEIQVPGGVTRTVSVWLDLTCDEDGVPVKQWGVVQDVTERVTAMRDLQASEEVFRLSFDRAPIGMTMLAADGSGRVLRANAAFREMIGRPGGDDASDPLSVASWTRPEDLGRDPAGAEGVVVRDGGHDTVERTYVRADGSTFEALVSSSVARDADGRPLHVLSHVVDVSERTAHARELERLAMTDGLTGLPNRRRMEERMVDALHRASGGDGLVGLVLLDLDHFKVLNDSLGHGSGDALLVDVAARLRGAVPPGATVARLGGDEFVAVVAGVSGPAEVQATAARMLTSLEAPFDLAGTGVVATASLGVAVVDGSGTPSELLRRADLALYRAKETGRDRVVTFDAELRTRADDRLATEAALRQALAHGWLRLHLQPVVDLESGEVVGAEALVRLEHPERGLLLPEAFMDVAEETGLVAGLDTWVLEEAVAGLAARPGTRVAVNVSGRTLEAGGLVERVRAVLGRDGVDPGRLSIELTETSLLGAAGVAADVRALRDMGCRVGLDDFGTGYSALSHLQTFELDFLKIDRSFISELGRGDRQDAVVTAVVGLAHAHRLVVVAEGVENDRQRQYLRAMGCDQAQGWFFGRPGAA